MHSHHVFLTGATGFIGSAVARALLMRGHQVTALVRPASVHRLPEGVIPCPGDLRQPDEWINAAEQCRVLVHAAYEYDAFGREVPEADVSAVQVMTRLLARGKHAVYTSNGFLLDDPNCIGMDELRGLPPALLERYERLQRESAICDAGGVAVRVGVVYGGIGGTMTMLLDALGTTSRFDALDGLSNRWSLIHIDDLAGLYCTVVEQQARGIYHGVDGTPLSVNSVVAAARAAIDELPPLADTGIGAEAGALLHNHRHVLERDIVLAPARSCQLGWVPRFACYHDGVRDAVREWHAQRSPQLQSTAHA